MRRLNLRCCCNPTLLLGSVPVPDDAREGSFVPFNSPSELQSYFEFNEQPKKIAPALRLEVGTVLFYESGQKELAVKSMDIPIELLRQIPGFEPAPTGTQNVARSTMLHRLLTLDFSRDVDGNGEGQTKCGG